MSWTFSGSPCSTRCWCCTPTPRPCRCAKLTALIGDRAREDGRSPRPLDDLRERALVWGDPSIRVAAEAAAGPALVPRPGRRWKTPPTTPADIAARLADTRRRRQRELLHRLLEGSPVGRTRDAAPGTPPDRPVQRLLAAGLLRQVDAETVILPRLVGQVLRGEDARTGAVDRRPIPWCRRPPPPMSTRPRPAPSSTCCARSSWCSKPSAPHRFPSFAAAASACATSSG